MNFFKLYIGDYQRDTAHMTIAEHGAYMLMLQHYYATEKPLPSGKALHRMLRAQDKTERDAIDLIVEQFWIETDAGLVNERADIEITKTRTQADTNARIAKEREDRRKESRKEHESCTNRATNDQPNHSHSQTKPKTKNNSALALLAALGIDCAIANDWIQLRKSKRAAITQTALDGIQREADKARLSLQDALRICCERGWAGFKAEWVDKAASERHEKFDPTRYVNDKEYAAQIDAQRGAGDGKIITIN